MAKVEVRGVRPKYGMPTPPLFEALEAVHDRASFLDFVQLLVDEREQASRLEARSPEDYRWEGALGWQNTTIEGYLSGALQCTLDNEGRNDFLAEPSWRSLAEFLYCGKIYE